MQAESENMAPPDNHPASIANQLESLPLKARRALWAELPNDSRGEVLAYLHDDVLQTLLQEMPVEEIAEAAEQMEAAEVADVVAMLSEEAAQEVIDSLSTEDRAQVEMALQFDDEQAGRLLDHEGISVGRKRTAGQVLRHIRARRLPNYTDKIYIVGARKQYLGAVALADILEAEDDVPVGELPMIDNLDQVGPEMPLADMAALFRQKHYVELPVIGPEGIWLGRITLDDAMGVIQDEADHNLLGMAGLDEEQDLFAPVLTSARNRAVWLGVNLLTALLASWVIGNFEDVLGKIVALAVLMPIVASMGGIAGSQTLTLVIRGLALDQVRSDNWRALLRKEIGVAMLNGVVWALAVGLIAWLWFSNPIIAMVIGTAIMINQMVAVLAGLAIPMVLERFGMDPALAGSVILTTVTDVVGFLSFLGLGSLLLL
ncbi:magnesium transporter [Biformimicrobium ophioploci]|nr:magnesium transporter [Microbulbifer sp. NKW57]